MSNPSAPVAPADDLIHESRITPVQGVILILFFLAYLLDGFDIVVIAFAAPAMSADLGILPQELGIIFSAGVLGMTLGAMFLSPLADLYGRKYVISLLLIIAGAATYAVVFVHTTPWLIVMRFIAGLALGTIVTTLAPLAGEYSPRRHRSFVLALMFSGSSVGPVIGGFFSAPLIEQHGWRAIFEYAGLLTMLLGVLFFLLVPESIAFLIKRRPRVALEKVNRILRFIGQATIKNTPAVDVSATTESASVVSLLRKGRRKQTLLIWATFFLSFGAVYFMINWIPAILSGVGFPQDQAILGGVVIAIGSIVGTILLGWLTRWWALNRIISGGFVLGALSTVLLSGLLQNADPTAAALIWVALLLVGVTLMGGIANLYTVALAIYPAQIRGTGLGWAAGLGRCGAVVSPAFAGSMIASGLPTSILFLTFAASVFAAAVLIARANMKELA